MKARFIYLFVFVIGLTLIFSFNLSTLLYAGKKPIFLAQQRQQESREPERQEDKKAQRQKEIIKTQPREETPQPLTKPKPQVLPIPIPTPPQEKGHGW